MTTRRKPVKIALNAAPQRAESPSRLIDARIRELGDWRGQTLSRIRTLIKQADPEVVEEVKWRKPSNPAGVPVWSHDGIICTGETYKNHVRLTADSASPSVDPAWAPPGSPHVVDHREPAPC